MRRKKIDVKLRFNRFTYDPGSLSEILPVALQARDACGIRNGIVFMKLTPEGVLDLYQFLEEVLVCRFDDRVLEAGGAHGK